MYIYIYIHMCVYTYIYIYISVYHMLCNVWLSWSDMLFKRQLYILADMTCAHAQLPELLSMQPPRSSNGPPTVGKLNLSCDVIVVNHFSPQVIVFEWAHIKQQSPDWTTVKHHHTTWSIQLTNYISNSHDILASHDIFNYIIVFSLPRRPTWPGRGPRAGSAGRCSSGLASGRPKRTNAVII